MSDIALARRNLWREFCEHNRKRVDKLSWWLGVLEHLGDQNGKRAYLIWLENRVMKLERQG